MIYISISSTDRYAGDKDKLYDSMAKFLPVIIQINKVISSLNSESMFKAKLVLLVGNKVNMEVKDV